MGHPVLGKIKVHHSIAGTCTLHVMIVKVEDDKAISISSRKAVTNNMDRFYLLRLSIIFLFPILTTFVMKTLSCPHSVHVLPAEPVRYDELVVEADPL